MQKEKIIKSSNKYTEVINNKISVKSRYYSIYYQESDSNKYGITVPKKIGKSNIRNKIKRRVKNIIITNEKYIQMNFNYVIIIKECILELNYKQMEQELMELFKKVRKI